VPAEHKKHVENMVKKLSQIAADLRQVPAMPATRLNRSNLKKLDALLKEMEDMAGQKRHAAQALNWYSLAGHPGWTSTIMKTFISLSTVLATLVVSGCRVAAPTFRRTLALPAPPPPNPLCSGGSPPHDRE